MHFFRSGLSDTYTYTHIYIKAGVYTYIKVSISYIDLITFSSLEKNVIMLYDRNQVKKPNPCCHTSKCKGDVVGPLADIFSQRPLRT